MSNVDNQISKLKRDGFKNFGYENGWKEEPVDVMHHKSTNHETPHLHDHHGDHLYWCTECKIFWQMDSSD